MKNYKPNELYQLIISFNPCKDITNLKVFLDQCNSFYAALNNPNFLTDDKIWFAVKYTYHNKDFILQLLEDLYDRGDKELMKTWYGEHPYPFTQRLVGCLREKNDHHSVINYFILNFFD